MKLDILSREIVDITITDQEVLVSMQMSISHGAVRKVVSAINIEHAVNMAPLFPADDVVGIDDAITMAVAGVQKRADLAVTALRGLSSL